MQSPLVFGGRLDLRLELAGTAIEEARTHLAFSVLENIRPMIETVPLSNGTLTRTLA